MKDFSRIKCFCFDVDGTLTTGALYFGQQGEALKVFNAQDGMIINLVRKLGYKVAFITGRESPMVQARASELHIDYLAMKCGRKLDALHTVCEKFNLSLDEAAYMGDDINDLPLIGKTGYFGAPANACRDVKEGADFVASRAGGEGAAREFMEFIVRGQGRWQEVLDFYLHA